MKIHILSDLHLEHLPLHLRVGFFARLDEFIKDNPADTCVLAGDLGSLYDFDKYLGYMREFGERYKNVVMTTGNHEYYGLSIEAGNALLRVSLPKLDTQNIHFLEPGKLVEIEGLTFGGGTGWYPDCDNETLKLYWIDYSHVSDIDPSAYDHNRAFKKENFNGQVDVMVSHMLPTEECVGARWRSSTTNAFFLMDLETKLSHIRKEAMPKLWICGHTHDPKDFVSKYGFRVYCNAKGYPAENANRGFWDQIAVEV